MMDIDALSYDIISSNFPDDDAELFDANEFLEQN